MTGGYQAWGRTDGISTAAYFYYFVVKYGALVRRAEAVVNLLTSLRGEPTVVAIESCGTQGVKLAAPDPIGLTTRIVPLIARKLGFRTEWVSPVGEMDRDYEAVRSSAVAPGGGSAGERETRSLPGGGITLIAARDEFNKPIIDWWEEQGRGRVVEPNALFRDLRSPDELVALGKRVGSSVVSDGRVKNFFNVCGIDFFDLFKDELVELMAHRVRRQVALLNLGVAVLRRITPAVMVSASSNPVLRGVCNDAGIRYVNVQHGAMWMSSGRYFAGYPMGAYTQMLGADYFMCFGNGVAENAVPKADESALRKNDRWARPVVIGSSVVDRYWRRPNEAAMTGERRFRVAYLPNTLVGDAWVPSHGQYPDFFNWRLQRKIIETLAADESLDVVYKQPLLNRRVVHDPLEEWIVDQRVPCIVERRSLLEIVDTVDAFVIDNPTTVFLQALATHKPILLFVDERYIKMDRDVWENMPERVVVITEECRLESALRQPREWGQGEAVDSDELLHRYGCCRCDGRSTERIGEFVRRLAEEGEEAALRRVVIEGEGYGGH